jgi:hypothetical protein
MRASSGPLCEAAFFLIFLFANRRDDQPVCRPVERQLEPADMAAILDGRTRLLFELVVADRFEARRAFPDHRTNRIDSTVSAVRAQLIVHKIIRRIAS